MAVYLRFGVQRSRIYACSIQHPARTWQAFISSGHKVSSSEKEILKENINHYIKTHEVKLRMLEALGCFGLGGMSSNLNLSEIFSKNSANWRFIWHRFEDSEEQFGYVHVHLSLLFRKGYDALMSYINDEPLDPATEIAVHALERFFNEKEYHEERLEMLQDTRKNLTEIQEAAILTQHLLSQLLPYPSNYCLDKFSRRKPSVCPCGCGIPIQYGFTHLGCPQLFQGNADMVLFPNGKDLFIDVVNKSSTTFKVVGNDSYLNGDVGPCDELDEDSSDPGKDDISDFEAEEIIRQTCKQAVAASVCKYKEILNSKPGELNTLNGDSSEVCFVPVCSVSRDSYDVTVYDAQHDFLLKMCHGSLNLFEEDKSIKFSAIIDLWLMINHDIFCSNPPQNTLNAIKGTCNLVPQLGKERFTSVVKNSTWLYQLASRLGKQPQYLPSDPSQNPCVDELEKETWRDVAG